MSTHSPFSASRRAAFFGACLTVALLSGCFSSSSGSDPNMVEGTPLTRSDDASSSMSGTTLDVLNASGSALSSAGMGMSGTTLSATSGASASVAPFDSCKGMGGYTTQTWYAALKQQAASGSVSLIAQDVPDACLSADYLVFIASPRSGNSSRLYRLDIHSQTLQPASAEGGYSGTFHIDSFGKRNGEMLPLKRGTCVTDTYNIRTNVYFATANSCRTVSAACSDPPKDRAIGDGEYPVDAKYKPLTYLGQIFTASDCGPDRLKAAFGGPDKAFTKGISLRLKQAPPDNMLKVLKDTGFTCSDGAATDTSCTKWAAGTITINQILKLKGFVPAITGDDCVNCG